MADIQLAIAGATKDDTDAYLLTMLARAWGRRLPVLAELKQFKDGKEMVDQSSVPAGASPNAAPVYRLMRSIGTLNLARRISESVTDRQQPNGFRKVSDREMKDSAADDMYRRCMMDTLLRCHLFPDTGDYGAGYGYVGLGRGSRSIQAWSPWNCYMSEDEDAAIHYSFDALNGIERLRLFRLERDDEGNPKRVYSKLATRESERTVVDSTDDEAVNKLVTERAEWDPGNTWNWDGGEEDYPYALACESLPIVRLSTPDGMGLYEPHLDTLKRIDRQIFDRLCITMMQAFRQRAIKGELESTYGPDDIEVVNGEKQEGDPIDYSERFAMGPAALWYLPDGVDIWESETTDVGGLQNTINADIKHLAATAGIPLDILSPDVQGSANGAELKRETLKFKVENLNALAAEAISRLIRMALVLDNNKSAADDDFELTWKPMVSTSSLELAQTAQLLLQSNVMARRTVQMHTLGFTAQDVAEDEMNRMADQLTFTPQSNRSNMPGAVQPATGWDETTQGAVDGLPQQTADTSDSITSLDGVEAF
ncbi:phage portal protein [Bifidobacterium myosotis]|uniref:Phage portal protein n=1 Tax=Bifidobacterium myosotis TaxID=1630166 RepID=A0A5M9ZHZ0_9BIFI|nr:phage portal protein [Bifidobacterium myosotis]KAA8827241.1 phage portal protein [Bifidobacterium myosotis]